MKKKAAATKDRTYVETYSRSSSWDRLVDAIWVINLLGFTAIVTNEDGDNTLDLFAEAK